MAWIRDYAYGIDSSATVNTISPDRMPEHESGDLLLLICGKDFSGGFFSVTTPAATYTTINSLGSSNVNSASFYLLASSSSETLPVVYTNEVADEELFCALIVVADVDQTTPIDTTASQVEGFTNSATRSFTSVKSTSQNNTLNVFLDMSDGNFGFPQMQPGMMELDYIRTTTIEPSIAWTYQYTSGTMFDVAVKTVDSGSDGHLHSVVVNSATSATHAPHADLDNPPIDTVHPLRGTDTSGDFGGGNVDPSTDLSGGIGPDSEAFTYNALAAEAGEGVDAVSQALGIQSAGSGTSYNGILGAVWDLSAGDYDATDKNLCIHLGILGNRLPALGSVADGGFIFGIRTDNGASGNIYRFWNVGAINSVPNPFDRYAVVVDPSDTTYQWGSDVGSGSIDVSKISGLFLATRKVGLVQARVTFAECHGLTPVVIKGGGVDDPCTTSVFADALKAPRIKTLSNQGGGTDKQQFSLHSLQIGNGTDDLYFVDSNVSIEFGATITGNSLQYNVGENGVGLGLYLTSGDTFSLTNSTISAGTVADFTIDASSTIGATIDVAGLNVINHDVVLRDVFAGTESDSAWIGCPTFAQNGADLSGGHTFDNTLITITAETTGTQALSDVANCTFKNRDGAGESAILITGNQSGTWTDKSLTVSNNTYDIEYTGTTNFTLTSATSLSVNNSSSGVLTVSAPTDDLTVNVDQTGCQIHVYTTNTQTTLDTEASAAQLVYTHSLETVDITVLKDGYIPYRQTGLALSGDVTVDVQLVESREYDSSHGLTFTTDAAIYANYNIITGITQANPAVVTYSGADNFSNSDVITLHDVVGMTEVNGNRYTVANVNTGANTFELSGINSTAFTAYTSAGIAVSGLSVPTFGPSGVGVFSLLMEQHRTNSALYNLPFNLQMDGAGALYLTNGVEGIADADIERMTAAGVGYLDTDATQTATWVGIESVGTIPGTNTGEWTADDATTVTDARTSGVFDEIIQIHGDTDHGNFDNRANRIVLKMNINGYQEQRVDVRALYGVSGNFKPAHYVVPIAPVAIEAATGDPTLTTDPVITDHGATPVTWNSKDFALTITDGATPNTGEGIIRHLNYFLRSANDTTLDGKDPFSWPQMVKEVVAGTSYETEYGYTEDAQTSTLKGVRVVKNDGTTAHPDFTRFQADDGTYYVAPITSNISGSGMPTTGADINLQIHNETAKTASGWDTLTPSVSTAALGDKILRSTGLGTENTAGLYYVCTTPGTIGASEPTFPTIIGNTVADGSVVWTCYAVLYYDADPGAASYADSYTDNEEFSTGDTYRIRFAEMDGGTSYKTFETTGIVTSTGFSFVVSAEADGVYATNGEDGSSTAITNIFTANYVNDTIVLDMNLDFTHPKAFAFVCYEQTTSEGMYNFWGGVTAIDPANYRNNVGVVDIVFDENTGDFVKQEDGDTSRWFRSDGARPYKDPTTGSGGNIGGIAMNWKNPVYAYDGGGGGYTASDRANDQATKANSDLILADTADMQPKLGTPAASISADIATRMPTTHIDATAGKVDGVATVDLTTENTDMRGTEGANTTAPDNSGIADIKAKTDSLTFTKANELDSNIQSVNDVTVAGTGADGDEWGP